MKWGNSGVYGHSGVGVMQYDFGYEARWSRRAGKTARSDNFFIYIIGTSLAATSPVGSFQHSTGGHRMAAEPVSKVGPGVQYVLKN